MNAALVESWELSLHGKQPRTVKHYLDEVWRFASWLAGALAAYDAVNPMGGL